jgi:hypothetical protein
MVCSFHYGFNDAPGTPAQARQPIRSPPRRIAVSTNIKPLPSWFVSFAGINIFGCHASLALVRIVNLDRVLVRPQAARLSSLGLLRARDMKSGVS